MRFYWRHVRPLLETLGWVRPRPTPTYSMHELIHRALQDPAVRQRMADSIFARNEVLRQLTEPKPWWFGTFNPPSDEDGNLLL